MPGCLKPETSPGGAGEQAVICLMGPTAAGKTNLALALYERFPCGIISVDSAQVYRGLDIGTAKPAPEVLRRVPHRLIDIRDPDEAYSAGCFQRDATREIAALRSAGRRPLLVGGAGLYFRSLLYGLSHLPPADRALRERLEREAAARGWESLHRRLEKLDPASARSIHPQDSIRIQRALEIRELTGRPASELRCLDAERRRLPAILLALAPARREALRERIAARFQDMLRRGFLDEAYALYRRPGLHEGLPAARLVGYRQAWLHFAGRLRAEELTRHVLTSTWKLARRQLIWLRTLDERAPIKWFDGADPGLEGKVLRFLDRCFSAPG